MTDTDKENIEIPLATPLTATKNPKVRLTLSNHLQGMIPDYCKIFHFL